METDEKSIAERLEAATTLLEKTLSWLEERQGALVRRGGEDFGDRRAEPAGNGTGREAGRGGAGAGRGEGSGCAERTEPAAQDDACGHREMLAKHGIGEGPVDVRTLDAALSGLSLEQRIAVKTPTAAGRRDRVKAVVSCQ